MSSDGFLIRVRGLGKDYQQYATPRARLLQFLAPPLRRLLGLRAKRYYRSFHALQDVSFEVGRGETVGIIGRNGSGKSTLLQIVCGTLTASSGQVETGGRIAALLELGSGFNPEFTGRENVYLNAAILGLGKREIDARFDDIARFADIGDFIDQPIKTYSSGMTVRLAFATAIHVEPDILVVDEALSVGDVAFQQKCLNRIRQMQRRGVTILLVTHSTNALVEYCDRGLLLKHGRLILDGPCRDVVKAYADDLVLDEGGEVDLAIEEALADSNEPEPDEAPRDEVIGEPVVRAPAPIQIESVALLGEGGQRIAGVESGGTVRVRVQVRVLEPIPAPCFGILLMSPDGIALWSTTTQMMDVPMAALEPGAYCFEWMLHAHFGGNRYVVAIGVGQVLNGEYKRCHRLDYAGHFDVLPEAREGAGWLAPRPAFSAPELVRVPA
jgi:homopolymeric O-antigen transport system ATP-binding protein